MHGSHRNMKQLHHRYLKGQKTFVCEAKLTVKKLLHDNREIDGLGDVLEKARRLLQLL